jgi:transcription initiation factor TFIIH subunit 2
MIRFVTLVLDFSVGAKQKDIRPSRGIVMKRFSVGFIREFFDLNPLSQLSIIATQNEKAFALSEFQDSPNSHIKAVEDLQLFEGHASI